MLFDYIVFVRLKRLMNNKHELNDIQKKLLAMFEWFHDFCEKYELKYYAQGGTMLGAVRHEGFIPWDDDIDVGMPRRDYERFLDLCKKNIDDKYFIETFGCDNEDYVYGYAKIYDTSTTLIEKAKNNVKRGIYIDVFPLDGIGNNIKQVKRNYKSIYWRYQFFVARTCALSERRAWYKNLSVLVARCIPDLIVNNQKILLKIDKLCKANSYDESIYIGNLLGNWGEKEIVKRELVETRELYKFESINIWGTKEYDYYLSSLYGDWRKLPPKEKQVTHHDYIKLDLEHGYING